MTDKTDWAELWHQKLEKTTFKGNGAAFWDHWAKSVSHTGSHGKYTGELLKRMKLSSDFSVLDVGAGTGKLTLPLAQRVQFVTALDQSAVMLDIIRKKAAAQNIQNIRLLHLDWNKATTGKDFQLHDIVLASRSLPSGNDITGSLKLIDKSAGYACYLTLKADGYDRLEADLCRLLNIEYNPLPEYTILYNLIYSLGILANVDIFRTNDRRTYSSLEEAYTQIVRSYPVNDGQVRQKIMDFLAARLYQQDGSLILDKKTDWALIWWEK
jgi:ubiquinone/menaquinone biosynthesis C-methylase UbiE